MFHWVVNAPFIITTIYKDDNSKNILKHEICLKLTLKQPERKLHEWK